jgi:hypothetical protein
MHIIVSLTLGFVLLPIIGDNQIMKNWIDFVKIKFHLIENIDWYCMKFKFKTLNWIEYSLIQILQLNWILYNSNVLNLNFIRFYSNWAKFNSNSIEEKQDANWSIKGIENMFIIMILKILLKCTNRKRCFFLSLFKWGIGQTYSNLELSKHPNDDIWNCSNDNICELKLSYLN